MNKIAALSAGLLLSLSAMSVMADEVRIYPAQANDRVEFVYEEAEAAHPLMVDITSEDGSCHFKVALTGVQQGATFDAGMVGRIEEGSCNGKSVSQGLVRASVSRSDKAVVLDSHMDVLVFN